MRILYISHLFFLFYFFSISFHSSASLVIKSLEHKDDGTEPNLYRNIWYLSVTEEPPAARVLRTIEAFHRLSINDGAPPPVQQAMPTQLAPVRALNGDMSLVSTNNPRLLKRLN